jgi:aromatic-L-amino-acid/L-tryptophan decarboxylase
MANFMSVLAARQCYEERVPEVDRPEYVVYTSVAAHRCIAQAVSMSGIQNRRSTSLSQRTGGIRKIPVTSEQKMDCRLLLEEIHADFSAGLIPLLVVATAGTVDVGAIDDLPEISRICKQNKLWMHVDGAYGALGVLSDQVKPLLQGINLADSIAFDFHKWGQVPPSPSSLLTFPRQVQYDAGMILVRNGDILRHTFSSSASYLSRETDGMLAGDFWPCDYGLDLSRSCRAMKTWFTIKVSLLFIHIVISVISTVCLTHSILFPVR